MNTLLAPTVPVRKAGRLESIDAVRGLAIILMALDHVREFLPAVAHNPLDPARTTLALFLTRWITHFCAPSFAFLAGMGAGLSEQGGTPRGKLSVFLVQRGLWLIALEVTILWWFGWDFGFHPGSFYLQVIWMLGASMIVLAGLIYLPRRLVAVIAFGQILGHNALDGIKPADFGPAGSDIWMLLHGQGTLNLPKLAGLSVQAYYPLIPWIGVVAAGYLFAPVMSLLPEQRRRVFYSVGWGSLAAFVVLRWTNLYGDPQPWASHATPLRTAFSFLNYAKYPPSLLYLLAELGLMFLVLGWFDRGVPRGLRSLVVFGRVPMFFYIVHIPLIHAMAVITCLVSGRETAWLFGWGTLSDTDLMQIIPRLGFSLGLVYVLWIVAVCLLYFLCKRFAQWKRTRQEAWVRFL